MLAKEIQKYQAKLYNIKSNSTSAQKNINKLELCCCELEVENTSLQNCVTEYKSLKEDANQHEMELTSKLKSKNDIIRLLKDVNMDSSKENLELCLGELENKNTNLQNLATQYQTDYESLKKDANQREMSLISKLESKNECIGALKDGNIKKRLIEDIKT